MPLVDDLIASAGAESDVLVIEAAAGAAGRPRKTTRTVWLDPISVITYAENIAEGLAVIDPEGAGRVPGERWKPTRKHLRELDAWIVAQVETIPAERRLLVTNHETLGYFAERYGFRIVGTVFPTVAGSGSPSAQQLDRAGGRRSGRPARRRSSSRQGATPTSLGRWRGRPVSSLVTDLYTHSLGENASTYLDMMRWNVTAIVEALR